MTKKNNYASTKTLVPLYHVYDHGNWRKFNLRKIENIAGQGTINAYLNKKKGTILY
jgi:hypothetical protein